MEHNAQHAERYALTVVKKIMWPKYVCKRKQKPCTTNELDSSKIRGTRLAQMTTHKCQALYYKSKRKQSDL